MMKNKTVKAIVNGVVVAAMAGLGITAYQLGTTRLYQDEVQEAPAESEVKPELPKQDERTEPERELGSANDLLEMETEEEEKESTEVGSMTGVEADFSGSGDGVIRQDVLSEIPAAPADPYAGAAGAHAPEIQFSEETLMEWPVNGNVLVDYSMEQTTYFPTLDQYKLSPAIAVQAVEGAPVVAAVNGKVYSIEQNAATGTTVTMELGNGYQAVYGQLTDLAVAEGDTVEKGTTIGYVGAPTKYYSKEGSNLYYAMKKDGEPIDPIAYLP